MPRLVSVKSFTLVNCIITKIVNTFKKEDLGVQEIDGVGGYIDKKAHQSYTKIIPGRVYLSYIIA